MNLYFIKMYSNIQVNEYKTMSDCIFGVTCVPFVKQKSILNTTHKQTGKNKVIVNINGLTCSIFPLQWRV